MRRNYEEKYLQVGNKWFLSGKRKKRVKKTEQKFIATKKFFVKTN